MVAEKLPDLPLYWVKPESCMGRLRTNHRDNILLIGSLVRIAEESDALPPTKRPMTKTWKKPVSQNYVTWDHKSAQVM